MIYKQPELLLFFTPIFKVGDENDFGNYQPISVLSCFSKY